MTYRKVGEAVTDENGRAVINYTGAGAGLIELIAETTIDGSIIQSETYEVIDAQFYDDGVSTQGGKLYYTQATSVVSRETDAEGTLVSNLSESLQTVRVNKPSTSADEKDWSEPLHIEFDIVDYSGGLTMQLWKSNTTGDYVGINIGQYLTNLTTANIKVEYNGTNVKLLVNDVVKINTPFAFVSSGLFGIRLLLVANARLKYKNFVVYPI